MKFGVAWSLLALLVGSGAVDARAATKPSAVFACSIGAKRVSVTKSGGHFVYRFGSAGKVEMSIVGDPAAGNIFRMWQRFAGPENQLRFTNGEFSYIVFSADGNSNVGAQSIAGLVVMRGTKTVSNSLCSRFAELDTSDKDFSALPEDTADFSGM
jgi:hypothetical protein